MPPYGLYSLTDRVDLPEELAARGYGEDVLYDYDPAFGGLRTTQRYQPAPFTGARPFQAMYDLSPVIGSLYGTNLGFDADFYNPSFGGVSGYRDTGGIMGIMQEEDEEDQLPYSGVGDMRYQTPRTIADQNRILGQTFTKQKPSGIARLFEVLGNIPTPMNILRGGLESLQGFNQRLRNNDFARSKTLAEYFDRRARAKSAARMAERAADFSERTSGAGATGGDRDFSTPAGKSTSYEEASRGFAASRR